MSNIVDFLKKHKLEITVVAVLVAIPVLEPLLEVLVDCLFTTGRYVGTWIRQVSSVGGFCR